MANSYFSFFDTVVINNIEIKNIFRKFSFASTQHQDAFRYLQITDERPEQIAYDLYGDTKLFWIILLANDIKDYFYDWPMAVDELIIYAPKAYEDLYGTGGTLRDSENIPTYDDYYVELYNANNEKKIIKVLKEDYLNEFLYTMNNLKGFDE